MDWEQEQSQSYSDVYVKKTNIDQKYSNASQI
jgi:hypothetical protein